MLDWLKMLAPWWNWAVFAAEWPMFVITVGIAAGIGGVVTWRISKTLYSQHVRELEAGVTTLRSQLEWAKSRLGSDQPALLAAQSTHPEQGALTLLGVDFSFEFVEREDLGRPINIRPIFRNDHSTPIAVATARWDTALKLPSTIADRGFQLATFDSSWSPRPGSNHLVVQPNAVFRAGITTLHADKRELRRLRNQQKLGTITLTVDGDPVSFTL